MGNNQSVQLVEATTLVDLLRWRVQQTPHQQVYTFLLHGDQEEASLTYAQLDQQARMVAAHLQQMGAEGQRAMLLYPPGLEYIAAFMGCLYAGVTAIPAYPPTTARLIPRIITILENAQSQIVLTCTAALTAIQRGFDQVPGLQKLQWINTDALASPLADAWRQPELTGETLAFLQYTSGSTSMPKGVMLTHNNLLSNLRLIQHRGEVSAQDHFVTWLPPYHDMGLIGSLLEPLYAGCSSTLMSPVAFLQRPLRWLQAITRKHATVSGGPNFAYDLCLRKSTPEQRAALDLSSWRLAFSGAEPVRSETIKRFTEAFAVSGFRPESFYPCYGMAETTLMITGHQRAKSPLHQPFQKAALEQHRIIPTSCADEKSSTLVGCGWVGSGLSVVIAHPEHMTRCQEDEVGEIWVAGDSVSRGYWNNLAETKRAFQAYLHDTGEGPFLRTGDLGFFYQGELFVTGRLKDVIILHGYNYYPQDIEYTVEESHPAIRTGCCAAFTVDVDNEERLVIVAEIDPRYEPERNNADNSTRESSARKLVAPQEVKSAIRQAISPFHDLPVYQVVLVNPGIVPKTSSGKIQRYACRAAFLAASLGVWDE